MFPQATLLCLAFLTASQTGEPSAKELAALKTQRDIADAYMRQATQVALQKLETVKDSKSTREILQKNLSRKRYFDTGTDAKDLAAFTQQLKEADQAKIKLGGEALKELLKASVQGQVDDKGFAKIDDEVRKQYAAATLQAIQDALTAEFRARIVRELNARKK